MRATDTLGGFMAITEKRMESTLQLPYASVTCPEYLPGLPNTMDVPCAPLLNDVYTLVPSTLGGPGN